MQTFRATPRSSDPLDFEHTAAVKDMEELTLAEKEYVSPRDDRAFPGQPAVSFSFVFPNTRTQATSVPTRRSPSGSRASQSSAVGEKFSVFKDSVTVIPKDAQENTACVTEGTAKVLPRSSSTRHLRTKSDSAVSQTGLKTTPYSVTELGQDNSAADRRITPSFDKEGDEKSIRAQLLQRLHDIGAKRAEFLARLGNLQDEEAIVFGQLSTLAPAAQLVRSADTALPSHSNVPFNPGPSITRIPSNTQPSRKALHVRTVSAPSPSKSQQPACKRYVPDTRAEPAPAVLQWESLDEVNRDSARFEVADGGLDGPSEDPLRFSGSTTTRIPTKPELDARNDAVTYPPKTPGRRGRVNNKSRGRSKTRVAAVETPGLARFYKVPDTFARKRWDF